jgi:hypothetical protein
MFFFIKRTGRRTKRIQILPGGFYAFDGVVKFNLVQVRVPQPAHHGIGLILGLKFNTLFHQLFMVGCSVSSIALMILLP